MGKAGEDPWSLNFFSTCQHHGRVFNFSQKCRKLVVTEVVLSEKVQYVSIITNVYCKANDNKCISCCSLGQHILVMAGGRESVFAALVDVRGDRLSESAVHITELSVGGTKEWSDYPSLCPIADDWVFLCFLTQNVMWYCEIEDGALSMKKLEAKMPTGRGFCTIPIKVPGRKILVAGAYPCSKDIILISCNENPTFEKVGKIPGEARCWASTILFGERFVVGLGGWNGRWLDDLWIFDCRTRRSSAIARRGGCHASSHFAFPVILGDTLYVINGNTSRSTTSIPLSVICGLIQDLDLQIALGLGLWQRHAADREDDVLWGMRDLGGYFLGYRSYNTIDHHERVFHFSQEQKKLCITEIFFGLWLKTKTVNTGIDCKTSEDELISCCSFNDKILVMAGGKGTTDAFCGLVSIDPGQLTNESIHIEEKKVTGWGEYKTVPFPAQLSENGVWVSFFNSDRIWVGEIRGEELAMTPHSSSLPTQKGFGAPPLPLPDGRFLTAGEAPFSTAIVITDPKKQLSFEKIGDMPGEGRYRTSTALVNRRFVIGFGGFRNNPSNELWIFDLLEGKSSPVARETEWCSASASSFLTVQDQTVYILGGLGATSAHSLPFYELARLILNNDIKDAFCECCKLSMPATD